VGVAGGGVQLLLRTMLLRRLPGLAGGISSRFRRAYSHPPTCCCCCWGWQEVGVGGVLVSSFDNAHDSWACHSAWLLLLLLLLLPLWLLSLVGSLRHLVRVMRHPRTKSCAFIQRAKSP
jgi:hypothetical protein